MKDLTAFTNLGGSHCSTALSFVGSMSTSLSLTTKPRYSTSVWSKAHLASLRWRSSSFILSSTCLVCSCCTHLACHGTLFPLSVLTLNLRLCANGCCRSVQARLCRKCCGHVISLGPYLLSMTSSPSALVAVSGFSSFHFRFAPLISAPFAIRHW